MCEVCLFWEIHDDSGNLELLGFKKNLMTGQTRFKTNTEWQYRLGEGVIYAWGLKGEKAVELGK